MSLKTETITITPPVTVFTPPSDCNAKWTYEASLFNDISNGLLMQNLVSELPDSTCFPKRFSSYGRAPSSIQVYSPYICPSGYTTPGLFNNAGTTTAICCQSGFSYYSIYSTIPSQSLSSTIFMGCVSIFDGTTTVLGRFGDAGLQLTTVEGPMTMWGQPVTVAFMQTDLALFSATTIAPSRSTLTSTGTPTDTSSTSTQVPRSSTELSSGAKIGIGVGVMGGLLVCLVIAAILILRKRRQRLTPGVGWTGPLPTRPSILQQTQDQRHGLHEVEGQRTSALSHFEPQSHLPYNGVNGDYQFTHNERLMVGLNGF